MNSAVNDAALTKKKNYCSIIFVERIGVGAATSVLPGFILGKIWTAAQINRHAGKS